MASSVACAAPAATCAVHAQRTQPFRPAAACTARLSVTRAQQRVGRGRGRGVLQVSGGASAASARGQHRYRLSR